MIWNWNDLKNWNPTSNEYNDTVKTLIIKENQTMPTSVLDTIRELPPKMARLRKLETLILGNLPLVEKIPDFIGNFTVLTSLTIQDLPIKTLPNSIGNLIHLTFLSVSYCLLESLPETIGNLTNLKQLRLNNNKLQRIPSSIGNLQNLYELTLYSNKLTSIPDVSQLRSLENLHLDDNLFTSPLPQRIGRLTQEENSGYYGLTEYDQYNDDNDNPYYDSDMEWYEELQNAVKRTPTAHDNHLYDVCELPRSSSPVTISPNETTYDAIMMEDISLADYLKEDENNILFQFQNHYYPSSKDTINHQITPTNMVYECKEPNTLRPENIIKEAPLFRLQSLALPVQYIYLCQINALLDSTAQVYKIKLSSPEKNLASVVSKEVLDGGTYVSASHCQDGQGGKVYTIEIADYVVSDPVGGKKKSKRRKHSTNKKKTKKRKSTKRKIVKKKVSKTTRRK